MCTDIELSHKESDLVERSIHAAIDPRLMRARTILHGGALVAQDWSTSLLNGWERSRLVVLAYEYLQVSTLVNVQIS